MNLLEDMKHPLWNEKGVVYCYINKVNGKRYIGQTIQKIKDRHRKHLNDSKNKSKHNYSIPFYRAIRKYGIENFELIILVMNCEDYNELNNYEKIYIKQFESLATQNGYNVSDGGNNANVFAGKTKEEMREFGRKISEARKGKYAGENHPNYGKKISEEAKRKMSETKKKRYSKENHPMYGKKHSEETRKKMSEMAKQRKDNPMRGKNHTEEFKDRMSDKKSVYSYINMDDMIYYKSARELTNNGYSKDCINSACRIGHYRKANGKHWIRFEKEKSPYLLDILYSKLTIEYKRELLYVFIQ